MLALVSVEDYPQVNFMTALFLMRAVYQPIERYRGSLYFSLTCITAEAFPGEPLLIPKLLASQYLCSFATTTFISTI